MAEPEEIARRREGVNHAAATGERAREVPSRVDLLAVREGPAETAISAPIVAVPRPPLSRTDGHALGRMAIYHGPILMAFDRRFDNFDPLALPAIDVGRAPSRVPTHAGAWEPLLLLKYPALDGRSLTLCDFASAGTVPWIPTRRWRFGRADGTILANELVLRPDGTIQGSTHPNESRWGFEGTDLTFFGADGRPTTRFAAVAPPDDRIRLEGAFLPNPAITHVLHQLDADVADTLWDFVRIDALSSQAVSPIRLEPFGRIHGYRHPRFPNEVGWRRDGADVIFVNHEGQPTTRFTPGPRRGESRSLAGAFIPNPQITHRLQELDVGWVRGSHYVSWLPAPTTGPVTALSTRPGGTSLFAVAKDGQVWSRFFPDPHHPGQWSSWFSLGPHLFPPESSVTALSTIRGGSSLYAIGFDEQVWTKFFPDVQRPGQWSDWFGLGPNIFCCSAPLTALSTGRMRTSLYVLGFDEQVWTRFFPDTSQPGQWSAWRPLGPNVFPPGSPVTAVSTRPGGTSLFVIGFDGLVWSRFFPDPQNPDRPSPWFALGPEIFPTGARIAALSLAEGATSLYVVGTDGHVRSRFFPGPRPGQWSDWFDLGVPQSP